METLFYGMLTGLLILLLSKSIYIIPTGRGYGIERLGTFYRGIGNFPGYRINDPTRKNLRSRTVAWELIKIIGWEKTGWFDNIYFFLYPLYKKKGRYIVYQKEISITEIQPGDSELWRSDDGKKVVVLRKSYSDHVRLRNPMPRVNSDVYTGDSEDADGKQVGQMARIITKSNNIVRLNNIQKAFYSTDDTILATGSAIDSRHRSFIATLPLQKIKGIEDEKGTEDGYYEYMQEVNTASELNDDGIAEKFGYTLEQPYFEAMRPGDASAVTLFGLMNKPAEEKLKAEASIIAGDALGKAYEAEWGPKATADHNYLRKTGKIKVDEKGNVTERVPDPDVKAMADAYKELGKTTGTVMIGSNAVPTIPVGNK